MSLSVWTNRSSMVLMSLLNKPIRDLRFEHMIVEAGASGCSVNARHARPFLFQSTQLKSSLHAGTRAAQRAQCVEDDGDVDRFLQQRALDGYEITSRRREHRQDRQAHAGCDALQRDGAGAP